jgi:uracil-DNA glycosylase
VENVTDRRSNPFGMTPPCDRFVPGYGDANAHFHVVGDHPTRHGGIDSGIPFTETPASDRLRNALTTAGLLADAGPPPTVRRTFLSYLCQCVPAGTEPTEAEYADTEPFFDAELRAITAHVLLPVGERPIRHVLETYTAREVPADPASLHATELRGGGFLVLPIADPSDWDDSDEAAIVEALDRLTATDYRREADLGRFVADDKPYFVR